MGVKRAGKKANGEEMWEENVEDWDRMGGLGGEFSLSERRERRMGSEKEEEEDVAIGEKERV